MRLPFFVLIVLVVGGLASVPVLASKRVALVIGNSDYEFAGRLKNPANDAEDMNAALKQLGFEVIYDIDLEKPQLEAKLHEFAKALSGADVGLFFYAGHGLQVDGRNYIMPTDAELTDGEHMLPYELVELSKIQKTMEAATSTNIILLDACRNNPLAPNLKKKLGTARSAAVGHGLAKIDARIGTLIGYSTHPGAVADDGKKGSRNSPFSAALKTPILTPGLSLDSMLKRVRRDVIDATGGKQVPWDSDSLVEDVYLGGKVEIPTGGGGDAGYQARLKKQIEASKSVAELDTLKRLEPAFGPMIEARKKELALLKEQEEEEARKELTSLDAILDRREKQHKQKVAELQRELRSEKSRREKEAKAQRERELRDAAIRKQNAEKAFEREIRGTWSLSGTPCVEGLYTFYFASGGVFDTGRGYGDKRCVAGTVKQMKNGTSKAQGEYSLTYKCSTTETSGKYYPDIHKETLSITASLRDEVLRLKFDGRELELNRGCR